MQVAFRTDASLDIGTGHVMRCLTLADALRASGAHCHFICREHPGNLLEQIRQHGFSVHGLPAGSEDALPNDLTDVARSNHAAWLGSYWENDAAQTRASGGKMEVDWLVVDHYALDERWERAMRPICHKLMVIDDLADRLHNCDLLLDQNLGRKVLDYAHLVPNDCTVIAGPNYAMLRPEFAALRDYSLRRRATSQLKHLLITMGGVDKADATGQILDALNDCPLPEDSRITVVMGSHAPWLERVQLLADRMSRPTEVKVNVSDMARLMADSDLAIGAAGSTSWERSCLGLPSLIGVIADNQRAIAEALHLIGAARVFNIKAGKQAIHELIGAIYSDFSTLARMSISAAGITDGCGTSRAVAQMQAIIESE